MIFTINSSCVLSTPDPQACSHAPADIEPCWRSPPSCSQALGFAGLTSDARPLSFAFWKRLGASFVELEFGMTKKRKRVFWRLRLGVEGREACFTFGAFQGFAWEFAMGSPDALVNQHGVPCLSYHQYQGMDSSTY